jgi:hypothetical protein
MVDYVRSDKLAPAKLRERPGDWLGEHGELTRRIVIPAELNWEVRDKLDQANLTERVLFPGLDGLTRWLVRYHAPRRRHGDAGD